MRIGWIILASAVLLLAACSSGSKGAYIIPDNMPEICQSVDFDEDPEMMEPCGVEKKLFHSKKTLELVRPLQQPPGAVLARYEGQTELRLPNFKPVKVPSEFIGDINFDEESRHKSIPNRMDYLEFGVKDNKKLFRLSLPQEYGSWKDLCFKVQDDSTLRSMSCKTFDRKFDRSKG